MSGKSNPSRRVKSCTKNPISTDGSKFGSKAVTHGVNLAKSVGASVTIITTTEMWSAIDMAKAAKSGSNNPINAYEQAAAESAKKILSAAESVAAKAGVKADTIHINDKHPAAVVSKRC